MRHAKAVLLVDDRQRQVFEDYFFLNDGVRAHHQACFAAGYQGQHFAAFFGFLTASEPSHFDT